jgi:fructokinase
LDSGAALEKQEANIRIGIDLGGSKIEIAALGGGGAQLLRERTTTPREYDEVIKAIVELATGFEKKLGVLGSFGVCTPGALSPTTGLIKNSNLVSLNGRPFHRDLERALSRPVRMANDADCFALSEAIDGAAAGARVVFGVILGTGTGGGVVVDGRLLAGPNAIAGEWGHNPLPWAGPDELPGPRCYCGRRGCIETFLSGPGLGRDHREATGRELAPDEIAGLADRGDGQALATLERYQDRLARALASVINILDPDVIVLGGGLSRTESLYASVPALWGRYVFSDSVETRLVKALHGDSSGVRGAAWLW